MSAHHVKVFDDEHLQQLAEVTRGRDDAVGLLAAGLGAHVRDRADNEARRERAALAGREHGVAGEDAHALGQIAEADAALLHEREVAEDHGRRAAAADIAADAHIHVDDRAHGRPGAAGLDDLTDERAGLVHDAVADLDAAVTALAERERARPVRRAVGHDVRGLELEVRVPLREAQQVTIALVFRDRLLPLARLRLSLGQLRAQLLVFGLELVIFINVAVDALEPLCRDGRGLLQRRAHDAVDFAGRFYGYG